MASEISVELSSIKDEDLLRSMWQQCEDFCRKREIRACMYKLREERLRNFYINEMDSSIGLPSKTPLTPSHGESLADQSFQSFKTKEIRDSESPTRLYKYGVAAPPDISGWNIVTSSEVSNDGKMHTSNTLATTGLEQEIPGGKSSFSGKNEEMAIHSHDGDDKNFTSTSGHTSNTVLNEQMVTGDENSKRFESRSNVSTSSSSFKTSRQQQQQSIDNSSTDDHQDVLKEFNNMINMAQKSLHTGSSNIEQRNTKKNERYPYDSSNKEHFSTSTSTNQTDNNINRQTVDKTIMSEGEKLISRSIDYPDAYTKVITETKTLPDGSIVTTKRYETKAESSMSSSSKQQMSSSSSSSRTISSSHAIDQHNERIESADRSTQIQSDDEFLRQKHHKDIVLNPKLQDEDMRRHEEMRRAEFKNFTSSKSENKSEQFIVNEQKNLRDESTTKHIMTDSERLTSSHATKDQSSQFDHIETDELDRSNNTHKTVKKDLSQQFKNERKPTVEQTHKIIVDQTDCQNLTKEDIQTDRSFRDNSSIRTNKVQTIKVHVDTTDHQKNVKDISEIKTDTIKSNVKKSNSEFVETNVDISDHRAPITTKITTTTDETDRESIVSELTEENFEHNDYRSKRISVDHQPTHDTFARSLRCVTPPNERTKTSSHRSSATSIRSNTKWSPNDRSRRSPSRDTEYSQLSQISSNTVTKSTSIPKDSSRPVIGSPDRTTRREASPVKNQSPTRVEKSQKMTAAVDIPLDSGRRETSPSKSPLKLQTPSAEKTTPEGALFCGTSESTTRSSRIQKETSTSKKQSLNTAEKSQKMVASVDIPLDRSQRDASPTKSPERAVPLSNKPGHNRSPSRAEKITTPEGSLFCGTRDKSPSKSPERPQNLESTVRKTSTNSSYRSPRESVSPTKSESPTRPQETEKIAGRTPSPAKSSVRPHMLPDNNRSNSTSPNRKPSSSFMPEKSQKLTDLDDDTYIEKVSRGSASPIKNRSPERAPHITAGPSKNRSPTRSEVSSPNKNPVASKPKDLSPERPQRRQSQETSPERRAKSTHSTDRVIKEDARKTKTSERYEIEIDNLHLSETNKAKTEVDTAEFISQKTIQIESKRQPSYAKPTESFARHTLPSVHVKTSVTQKVDAQKQSKIDRQICESDIDFEVDESIRTNSPTSTVSDIEYVHMANKEVYSMEWQSEDVHDGAIYSVPVEPEKNEQQPKEDEPFYLIDKDQDDAEPKQQKPKTKVPYTRSETYEERCRAMLGMNSETVTTKSTEQFRYTVDEKQKLSSDTMTTKTTDQQQVQKIPVGEDTVDFVKPVENVPTTRRFETKDKPSVEMANDKIYEIIETVNKTFSKKQETEAQKKEFQTVEDQSIAIQEKLINQKRNNSSILKEDRITDETVNKKISKKQQSESQKEGFKSVEDQNIATQEKLMKQKRDDTSTLYADRIPVVEEFITKESAYVCGKKSSEEKTSVTHVKPSRHSPARQAAPSDLSPERRRSSQIDEETARRTKTEIKEQERIEVYDQQLTTKPENIEKRSPSRSPGRKPISAEVHPNKRPSQSESPDRMNALPQKEQPTKVDSRPVTKSPERKKTSESNNSSSSKFAKTREVFRSKLTTESSPDRRQPTKQFPDTPRPGTVKDVSDQRRKPASTTTPLTSKQVPTTSVTKTRENSIANRTKEQITTSNQSSTKVAKVNTTTETKDVRDVKKTLGTVRTPNKPGDKPKFTPTQNSTETKPKSKLSSVKQKSIDNNTMTKHVSSAKITLTPTKPTNNGQTDYTTKTPSTPVDSPKKPTNEQKPNENRRRKSKPISSDYSSDEDNTETVITTKVTETKAIRKLAVTDRKDSAPVYRTTKSDKDSSMIRSTSDATIKSTTNGRRRSKPDDTPQASQPQEQQPQKQTQPKSTTGKHESRRPTKCITTKTINLTTTNVLNSEDMENVIIDIQQAKSSREPTPNRIIPTPVMPGETIEGKLRYPDTVHEPDDDGPRRRQTITHIPIFEEDTKQFVKCHIMEVTDDQIEQVTETDDCLLSVSDKVSKFSNVTTTSSSKTTKNEQRNLTEDIDEGVVEADDECLLSVHDKVSKFISTAEEVKRPKTSQSFRKPADETERFLMNEKIVLTSDEIDKITIDDVQDECLLSVNDKVTKFLTTADQVTKTTSSQSKPLIERPNLEEVDVELRSDDCLLSVSDKVTKFISTAERLSSSAPQKSPELVAKIERQVFRKEKPTAPELEPLENLRETSRLGTPQREESIQIEPKQQTPQREIVPQETSSKTNNLPDRSEKATTPKRDITERYIAQKEKPKPITSEFPTQAALRSTEIVKNAKAIFERGGSPSSPKQPKDIISRPSVWDERRSKETKGEVKLTDIGVYKRPESPIVNDTKNHRNPTKESTPEKKAAEIIPNTQNEHPKRSSIPWEKPETKSKSRPAEITQSDTQNEHPKRSSIPWEKPETKSKSFDNSDIEFDQTEKPSYMNHTVCSLEHIRRESLDSSRPVSKKHSLTTSSDVSGIETPIDGNPRSSVKFGVELKRTNSQQSQGRRKSSSADIPHVEEVFELDLLEKMLETVVGYEQRRRIRSQIRIVKKQKLQQQIHGSTTSTKFTSRVTTPKREQTPAPVKQKTASPSRREKSPLGKSYAETPDRLRRGNSKETTSISVKTSSSKPETYYKSRSPSPRQTNLTTNKIESEYTSQYSKVSNIERTTPQLSATPDTYVSRSPSPKSKRYQKPETYTSGRSPSPRSSKFESISNNETTDDRRESEYTSQYCRSSVNRETNNTVKKEQRSPSPKGQKNVGATTGRIIPKTVDAKDRDADKPIWATKNILKKATETSATRTFKMTTPKKITQKVQKQKLVDTTVEDCVTSSYGIGPTDEDGNPLFGIRALKKKTQPSQTTKVTGTILKESLYSENGSTPMGSRSITHFSNNPDDLRNFDDDSSKQVDYLNNGIASITKTEIIGNGDKAILDKKTPYVRRGSVKELSEKFIQKETSDKSTSSSYPKAGLILRSKDQRSRESTPGAGASFRSGSEDFDECDVELRSEATSKTFIESDDDEIEYTTSSKFQTSSASRHETQSFLNSGGKKISGVQDVLDRMRNADNVEESGDTDEDKEARALLNKFLGASVLMTGMESMMPREITTERSTKQQKFITSTSSSSSRISSSQTVKSSSTKRTAACDIETVWDENYLKDLLEQSSDYEERRKIRARLRQVMADKEACADIVASVTAELKEQSLAAEDATKKPEIDDNLKAKTGDKKDVAADAKKSADNVLQGESLLLPLLQGLLQHKKTPQRPQLKINKNANTTVAETTTTTGKRSFTNGSGVGAHQHHHHIEDSGTESGEDLKLLAAGLHDHIIEQQRDQYADNSSGKGTALQTDLLAEVTSALNRLHSSLVDGSDIELDIIRRNALLTLVSRLQTGLLAPEKITTNGSGAGSELSSPEVESLPISGGRRPSGHGRFAKRKNRQNRHTVGVSQEELADARRYIEELVMIESLSNAGTPEALTPPSNGSIVPYTLQKQSSAGAVLSAPTKDQTPLFRPNVFVPHETKEALPSLPQPQKLKRNDETHAAPPIPSVQLRERKPKYKFTRQSLSLDQTANECETSRRPFSELNLKSSKVVQAAVQRVNASLDNGFSSDDEVDTKKITNPTSQNRNVLEKNFYNKIHHSAVVVPKTDLSKQVRQQTNNTLFNGLQKMYRSRTPPGKTYEEDITAASGGTQQTRIGTNKYNNKKIKMKRANTIDIPKAFNYPDDDDETDDELMSREEATTGLKGTIQAGGRAPVPKKVVPNFTPKTENDHKFLAFIQKQNENNLPTWINPNKGKMASNKFNWNSAFGNLKKTFENTQSDGECRKPPMVANAARSFWKQSDSPVVSVTNKYVPKSNPVLANVALSNGPPRQEQKPIEPVAPTKIVVPKPIPVNEFSHAPMSAFQPPIVRNVEKIIATFKPIKAPEPKPMLNGSHNSSPRNIHTTKMQPSPTKNMSAPFYQTHQITSPTGSIGVPWANRLGNDHRVLNLAAAKFDNLKSPPIVAPVSVGIPLKSNRMFSSPNFPARNSGIRLQQKRGSLPNDSTYSYLNDGDIPYSMQTQQNTLQNENLHYAQPVQQHDYQQYNYGPSSMPSYHSEPIRQPPQPMYQPPQPMHQSLKYNLPPAQPQYYNQQPNYYPIPPQSEPRYRHHPSPTHSLPTYISAPPPSSSIQHQQQYHRPQPPPITQSYQPPPQYIQSAPHVSNEFPAYPYTCTDYTQPACISTYIPKVTVTHDRTHSITSPSGEPLVLSNTRPIISPNSHPELLKCFDYPSSSENSPLSTSVSPHTLNDPLDDELEMPDLQEHMAAKTQVMKGPVSQTAVTVSSKTSRVGDNEKESQAAKSLHSVLKGIKNRSPDPRQDIINKYAQDVYDIAQKTYKKKTLRQEPKQQKVVAQPSQPMMPRNAQPQPPKIIQTPSTPMAVQKSEMPSHIVYNHVPETMPYHMTNSSGNNSSYPYYNQSVETRSNGDTVLTGNFRIPVNQQHYSSALPPHSTTTMYNNDAYHAPAHLPPHQQAQQRRSPVVGLSKSDSWTQICQATNKPTTNGANDGKALQRTKSGHTLLIPKQFEAGIKKIEAISDKQRTVAAYFSGQKSPQSLSRSSSQQNIADATSTSSASKQQYSTDTSTSSSSGCKRKTQITRIKTSEKASVNKQVPSSGLARSHTMPYMANLNLLDEKSSPVKTDAEKDDVTITTTQKVATQTISSAAKITTTTAAKPVSPFAKFRQLDRQSSTPSSPNTPNSPTTPMTPGGTPSAPLFKFTDPVLNARAATVKDILLQWCQSKTKEYENVNISNFSTAWSDGLAFCALIHHFQPDAFDYSVLTPKQRRHNFTLAFRVADEKAGIAPLLDVEDMVMMKKPDWKCVFTYVQSIHRRFRNVD